MSEQTLSPAQQAQIDNRDSSGKFKEKTHGEVDADDVLGLDPKGAPATLAGESAIAEAVRGRLAGVESPGHVSTPIDGMVSLTDVDLDDPDEAEDLAVSVALRGRDTEGRRKVTANWINHRTGDTGDATVRVFSHPVDPEEVAETMASAYEKSHSNIHQGTDKPWPGAPATISRSYHREALEAAERGDMSHRSYREAELKRIAAGVPRDGSNALAPEFQSALDNYDDAQKRYTSTHMTDDRRQQRDAAEDLINARERLAVTEKGREVLGQELKHARHHVDSFRTPQHPLGADWNDLDEAGRFMRTRSSEDLTSLPGDIERGLDAQRRYDELASEGFGDHVEPVSAEEARRHLAAAGSVEVRLSHNTDGPDHTVMSSSDLSKPTSVMGAGGQTYSQDKHGNILVTAPRLYGGMPYAVCTPSSS